MICRGCDREVPDDGTHGACAECRARWYEEKIAHLTSDLKRVSESGMQIMYERDAARVHFRRACEKLAETSGIADSSWCKPADVWQVEIMVEVNRELGEKKP